MNGWRGLRRAPGSAGCRRISRSRRWREQCCSRFPAENTRIIISSKSDACRIASQAALASLREFLRPDVIQRLGDAFAAAQIDNAVIPAQAIKDNPSLVLGRVMITRRASNGRQHPLSGRLLSTGFWSHLHRFVIAMRPKPLGCSIPANCLIGADGETLLIYAHAGRLGSCPAYLAILRPVAFLQADCPCTLLHGNRFEFPRHEEIHLVGSVRVALVSRCTEWRD